MTLAEIEAWANIWAASQQDREELADFVEVARTLLVILPVVRAAQRDAAPSVEVQAALSHLHATTEGT